ncbi:S8 family serine peptidase [Deinococcus radiophilus]
MGSGYKLSAGTSEASALVSGAASLIRNAYPGLNAAQVRQA